MVEQQSVSLIVMLTQLREHEKNKCDQYWPTEVGQTANGITLLAVEQLMTSLIKRSFQMSDGRLVTQVQYLAWPDHGAPEEHDYKIITGIL